MTWKHFVKNGNILYKNGNILYKNGKHLRIHGGGGGGHNFATNFFSKCFSEMVGIVLVITYKWEASDPLQKIGFPRSEMTWKHFVKNGNILYKNGNI